MDPKKLYSLFSTSTGVSIDSRKIDKNQMFFSLRGNNFDGNKFALEAIKNGAKFSIVDDKRLEGKDDRIVYVNDALKALQDLSNYHRSLFDTKVIGVTGSNGKTTTKNLIYSILSQTYNVIKTKGNLNNHIGVPLSLLDIFFKPVLIEDDSPDLNFLFNTRIFFLFFLITFITSLS